MKEIPIPSSWSELTYEQLQHIHAIYLQHEESRVLRNLHVWMYLADIELTSDSDTMEEDAPVYIFRRKGSDERFRVRIDQLQLYLCGTGKTYEDGENTVRGALWWLDYPFGVTHAGTHYGGLLTIPQEEVVIAGRHFLLPQPMMMNITYEQYTNLQKMVTEVFRMVSDIEARCSQLADYEREMRDSIQSESDHEIILQKVEEMKQEVQRRVSEISSLTHDTNSMKARVLCHALTPRHWNAASQPWRDNLFMAVRCIMHPFRKHLWYWNTRYEWKYDSMESESMHDWMSRNAPPFLFEVITQHLHSCMAMYKTQFTELFGESDGNDSDLLPVLSECATLSAIAKWQNYQNEKEVQENNAVLIFGVLNSMIKEARSIEDQNRKLNS